MRHWDLMRCVFTSCAAGALLAGCGAQGNMPLTSTPGAMPESQMAARTRGDSTNYKVLYSFGRVPDGNYPLSSLIDVGGTLYGVTRQGGSNTCAYPTSSYYFGCGAVFGITPGGAEKVLYSFAPPPDGHKPWASLLDVGGTLYGTTNEGGSNTCGYSTYRLECGTVFSLTLGGTEKVLHSFNGTDGWYPVASLIEAKSKLYGTTKHGGADSRCDGGCGTVFSITRTGREKALHSFGAGGDGAEPAASLIEVKGTLYGATIGGGAYGCGSYGYGYGTVFSITPSGTEKVLYSFRGSPDGYGPGRLIELKGTLYGTTGAGGTYNDGTVFSITPSGMEKVLHSFGAVGDGEGPVDGLIAAKGTLYGTTVDGGAYSCGSFGSSGNGCGTVFSITPGGTEKVLHSFGSGTDGFSPEAGLIKVKGTLYGTTYEGGTLKRGTVFTLTP